MITVCMATLSARDNVPCSILSKPSASTSKCSPDVHNDFIKNCILAHHPTQWVKAKELVDGVSVLYWSNDENNLFCTIFSLL